MDAINAHLVILTGLVTALTGLVPVVINLWKKISKQERRFTQFWRSRILRGTAEGLSKRLLTEHIGSEDTEDADPDLLSVAVVPLVYEAYKPIIERLVATRKKYEDAEPTELAEIIEERFGPWLVANICLKLRVTEYACIVMAMSLANEIKPVEAPENDLPPPTGSGSYSPLPPR